MVFETRGSGVPPVGVLDLMSDGVYAVDTERRITYWSAAAERITGFRAEELIGRRCFDNVLGHVDEHGRSLCATSRCPLACTMRDQTSREGQVYFRHRDGHRVPVLTRTLASRSAGGVVDGGVEVFTDLSRAEADAGRIRELEELAYLDPLTEIPNRRFLEETLAARIRERARCGRRVAVALVDADHFKSVNDRWGHETGDRVLRAVAKTLRGALRGPDVVGRWGGEEFVAIMAIDRPADIRRVCDRLRGLVAASAVPVDGAVHG